MRGGHKLDYSYTPVELEHKLTRNRNMIWILSKLIMRQ